MSFVPPAASHRNRAKIRSLGLRIALFLVLSGLLFGGTFLAPRVLSSFARAVPDNYVYLAEQALGRGDLGSAEKIVRRRIDRVYWDMQAHYLLARILATGGKPLEAADVVLETMHKVFTARGRDIRVTGYDEALALLRLSGYLWDGGRFFYAGEMYRAAVDAGADDVAGELAKRTESSAVGKMPPEAATAAAGVFLKLQERPRFDQALAVLEKTAAGRENQARALVLRSRWVEAVEGDPHKALSLLSGLAGEAPLAHLAKASLMRRLGRAADAERLESRLRADPGVRNVSLDRFSLPVGAVATSTSLEMSRRGTAAVQVQTGAFRVTDLLLMATGSPAFGLYPVIAVDCGSGEVLRLYLDGLQPYVASVPLYADGAPKELDLAVQFLNDAYDPATRADRGVRVNFLGLH